MAARSDQRTAGFGHASDVLAAANASEARDNRLAPYRAMGLSEKSLSMIAQAQASGVPETQIMALAPGMERAKGPARVSLKVSEKGCVSLYGLTAQYPVSLYPSQWEVIFGMVPEILAFIAANRDDLTFRGDASRAAKAAASASAA